ncbi:MAG: hypothetical protein CVU79_01140 [Elusimicrobia bacterium HGW-Elusimicrobia-3]|nr:MAG: hypothetical protein CVU79_01140 [Elusimicrobia bacterium HGW-Elusimicrobia-3]
MAPAVYAADNGTEFGIEDDLTVLGTGGAVTPADPDLEVKGFTVFGSTQTAYTGLAAPAAGDVVVNGYLAVSSGAYFVGGSTFAAGGAYFTGVSSFSNVANVHFGGGVAGQVLSKQAGGGMQWTNVSEMVSGDNLGSHIATTTLNMAAHDLEDAGYVTASSAALSGQLVVYGTSTLTGNTGVGGTLGVTGAAALNGNIALGDAASDIVTVNGQSSFVAGSTFSAGAYFTDISSFSDVAKVHFGGGAPDQVLKKAAGGGMQWTNVSDMVSGDNLGSHIATTTLQMANNEIMAAGHITASSATLTETFNVAGAVDFDTTLNVDGSATLRGNNQLGDAFTDDHGINVAAEDGVALKVAGEDVSNKYAAKFYSGANLAAWIKKK